MGTELSNIWGKKGSKRKAEKKGKAGCGGGGSHIPHLKKETMNKLPPSRFGEEGADRKKNGRGGGIRERRGDKLNHSLRGKK